MLFQTVYGPELESIFYYIYKNTTSNASVYREQIYATYLPHTTGSSKGQTKNIDDAMLYLKCAGLIEEENGFRSKISSTFNVAPFAALLLRQFRYYAQQPHQLSSLDLLYITLLERLYIDTNHLWIEDVHAATNQLDLARQVGGTSQEKITAWKRVMEFLGVGYRMGGGFYCLYRPSLVLSIAKQWHKKEGTLQNFLEDHLHAWIPCLTNQGDIASPAIHSLEWLNQQGNIRLFSMQDSPSRPYFGVQQFKGIEIP